MTNTAVQSAPKSCLLSARPGEADIFPATTGHAALYKLGVCTAVCGVCTAVCIMYEDASRRTTRAEQTK